MPQEIRNISVLMPTYNCAQYISFAIKSILNQTFREYEFLIIDDGSIDNTEDIVTGFKDSSIRYVKKEHSGLASSLNYGLSLCTYDWVARMDADDICHPMRLERQLESGRFDFNSINCTWSCYFKNKKLLYTVETPVDIARLKLGFALHSYICHSSIIYNRDYILLQGGYNENLRRIEDYELWLRIMNYSTFQVLPEYLLLTRIRQESLSRENLKDSQNVIYSFQKPYYDSFEENFQIKDTAQIQMFKGWREYFYGNSLTARKYWSRNIIGILTNYRIFIAYIISFLPSNLIQFSTEVRIRYRLKYLFSLRKKGNRKLGKQLIAILNDFNKVR